MNIKQKKFSKEFRDANGNNAQIQDSEGNAEGTRLRPRRSGNRKGNGRRGSKATTRELADDKTVVSESGRDRPEVTILKRWEVKHDGDLMKSKEVVRTLVERIPEKVLRRTTIRKKRV